MTEIALANNIEVFICSVLPAKAFPWSPSIKNVAEKVEEKVEKAIEEKKLADTPVEDTAKPEVKKEIAKKEQYKKSDEKLVQEATEKEWADVDTEQKITWMQFHELLPRLIVENEKIKAAELDYEAAVEALKSEYTACLLYTSPSPRDS